jgi:twitching motility two-component system response regulator PilG
MNQTTTSYTVATFGVLGEEKRALHRIFSLSSRRPRTYLLASEGEEHSADMFIVDKSFPADLPRWQAAKTRRPDAPTLFITGEDSLGEPLSLRKPLMVTRVLGTLDKLMERRPEVATTPAAATVPCGPIPRSNTTPPKSNVSAPGQPLSQVTPSSNDVQGIRPLRALVVDDSLTARKQLSTVLARAQIVSDIVEAGEEALERIDNNHYDIILLDVVMPGVSGYEVCRTIKRSKASKHTPVIMLTGKSSPFDKVKGKLSGCDSYLTKPVKLTEFKKTLEKCLKQPVEFKQKKKDS